MLIQSLENIQLLFLLSLLEVVSLFSGSRCVCFKQPSVNLISYFPLAAQPPKSGQPSRESRYA